MAIKVITIIIMVNIPAVGVVRDGPESSAPRSSPLLLSQEGDEEADGALPPVVGQARLAASSYSYSAMVVMLVVFVGLKEARVHDQFVPVI